MKKSILMPFALAFGLTCMSGCEMESHKKAPSEQPPSVMKEVPPEAPTMVAPPAKDAPKDD